MIVCDRAAQNYIWGLFDMKSKQPSKYVRNTTQAFSCY